jgi:hypothetical protein
MMDGAMRPEPGIFARLWRSLVWLFGGAPAAAAPPARALPREQQDDVFLPLAIVAMEEEQRARRAEPEDFDGEDAEIQDELLD